MLVAPILPRGQLTRPMPDQLEGHRQLARAAYRLQPVRIAEHGGEQPHTLEQPLLPAQR